MAGHIYWHQLDEELVTKIKDAFNGILTPDGTTITVNESGVISANGGDSYVLPTASTTVLGGVKVDGTTITIDTNGVITSIVDAPIDIVNDLTTGGADKALSAEQGRILKGLIDGVATYVLPTATTEILGGVKQGTGVTIDGDGRISVTGSTSEFSIIDALLPTVKPDDVALPNGISMFSVYNSATFNGDWATALGLTLNTDLNRAVIETYKNSKASTLSYQTVKTFLGSSFKDIYLRPSTGASGWGAWVKVFPVTTEKPKTVKFTTTVAEATIVNGSESETIFVYKPSIHILSTDDLDVNYNTTSLKEGDWRVQDVEGEMVIILNVTQDANIAKNSVSGRIYRGFSSI